VDRDAEIAVVGAGPAGLTAAHVLASRGHPAAVYEADTMVGGLAKTVRFDGYRFDLGGHRFYTKLGPVDRFWRSLLGDDFLVRPRRSRIYYRGRYFAYPLQARDVLAGLGVLEAARCTLSYAHSRLRRDRDAETFEDWVTARFGSRLYDRFFRSYTEKVWGLPGSEIRAEWAAQRIRDFSLMRAVVGAFGLGRREVVTLIEEFHYPRLGPGQLWEELARRIEARGAALHLRTRCVGIRHSGGRVRSLALANADREFEVDVRGLISTMPLRDLVPALDPQPNGEVRAAADGLRHRSLNVVALITEDAEPFPDNWVYLHDSRVRAGRVQNFGAWSPDMVRPGTTCLGVEYFCWPGDEIDSLSDEDAIALAGEELGRIGLLDPDSVTAGARVRVPDAYPVYDAGYRDAVLTIHRRLGTIDGLETCGRNGLHRYNNQDHSMLTGALAALNIADGARHDVWSVNAEADYLEEGPLLNALDLELVA
jgi:protoporphyrinogen oxidase